MGQSVVVEVVLLELVRTRTFEVVAGVFHRAVGPGPELGFLHDPVGQAQAQPVRMIDRSLQDGQMFAVVVGREIVEVAELLGAVAEDVFREARLPAETIQQNRFGHLARRDRTDALGPVGVEEVAQGLAHEPHRVRGLGPDRVPAGDDEAPLVGALGEGAIQVELPQRTVAVIAGDVGGDPAELVARRTCGAPVRSAARIRLGAPDQPAATAKSSSCASSILSLCVSLRGDRGPGCP